MNNEWLPFSTAPDEGNFLVWLKIPKFGNHIFPMRKSKNVTSIIGTNFTFDMPTPTHWRPELEAPIDMKDKEHDD